jgi:hypothetical protein
MSSGAQYVTLQKHFSHPSLVIYFFPTPPIKLAKILLTSKFSYLLLSNTITKTAKILCTSKFSYLLLSNTTNKTKTGTASR